jgi:hypothetical protein
MKIEVPDSVFGGAANDACFDSQGMLYIVDVFRRKIIRTTPRLDNFTQIGEQGMGPGEYQMPTHIDIDKHSSQIYFTDAFNTILKSIPLNTTNDLTSNYMSIPMKAGGLQFLIGDSLLLVLDERDPFVSAYNFQIKDSLIEHSLQKEFLTIENFYHPFNEHVSGGGIANDSQGNYYITMSVPYHLWIYDSDLNLKREINLEKLPGVIPWTEKKYKKLFKLSEQEQYDFLLSSTVVIDIAILKNSKRELLFISIVDQTREEMKRLYHLLTLDGKLLSSYRNNFKYLAANKSILYFYEMPDKDDTKINFYTFELL